MKNITLITLFLIYMFFVSTATSLELNISGDRLSIQADNTPLNNILQALTDKGIKVSTDPQINRSITASFTNRELESGLKTLFKNLNYILIWKPIGTPLGQFDRLEEVHLFTPGKKDLIRPLTPKARKIQKNPHNNSLFIQNEILLRLSKKINLSDFKKFLMKTGATVAGYNKISGIIKISLSDNYDVSGLIESFKNYPGIESAEPNYVYPIGRPYYRTMSSQKNPEYQRNTLPENSIPVAVIDSGLSQEYQSESYIYASFNCLDPEEPITDALGHGTQMAMIAGGMVKPVGTSDNSGFFNPVIAIKGFDENGYISNFDLLNGVEFAINNGARVLSLSWGSETKSDFLEQTLNHAATQGLIVLGAAGNEPTGADIYPAAYNSVIGVGALDPQGGTWDKSNYGDFVTIYASGFASFPVGHEGEPGTYAGTSISTAYVANLIAGELSKNPEATLEEILIELLAEAKAMQKK